VRQATSPSSNRPYGVAAVARVWAIQRSTINAIKKRQTSPNVAPAKRGTKTGYADAELAELIRHEIMVSPFHGQGQRKIWERLRIQDIHTAKRRVLRPMRESQQLVPTRSRRVPSNENQGRIITNLPNQV